eukprot:scaffold252475_cov53-Prasinocladus_malaysianus.AAC.1
MTGTLRHPAGLTLGLREALRDIQQRQHVGEEGGRVAGGVPLGLETPGRPLCWLSLLGIIKGLLDTPTLRAMPSIQPSIHFVIRSCIHPRTLALLHHTFDTFIHSPIHLSCIT